MKVSLNFTFAFSRLSGLTVSWGESPNLGGCNFLAYAVLARYPGGPPWDSGEPGELSDQVRGLSAHGRGHCDAPTGGLGQ